MAILKFYCLKIITLINFNLFVIIITTSFRKVSYFNCFEFEYNSVN